MEIPDARHPSGTNYHFTNQDNGRRPITQM
jgi:hypothetical protein